MAINSPLNIAAQPGKTRLRKSLKLWQVVMMGLAYLTPMTVFDTFGIVSGISDGHVPALKRRTKNAKTFHDKCENFNFRASNETAALTAVFLFITWGHFGYG